jgi:hypothetical protein
VWTLDDQLQNSANWPTTNVLLNNSVRTRASASAYMTRTPTVAGNRRTWTWSAWVKRGQLGGGATDLSMFSAGGTTEYFDIRFNGNDQLFFFIDNSLSYSIYTSSVFRDPSAWYHVVATFDTTQATASNRAKLYVNGVLQPLAAASYPAQNYQGVVNSVVVHSIGRRQSTTNQYFDGYLADMNFIDGQALDPSYFGATNPNTGVWQPSQYKGTYGTNGFYLPMNIEVLLKSFTRSLRFRSSASAGLQRTFSATRTSDKIMTFSTWLKRGSLASGNYAITRGYDGSSAAGFGLNFGQDGYNDQITFQFGGASGSLLVTTAVYRDPASWYHIVLAIDTTQATSSNRIKIYVNGSQVTSFAVTNYPSQNATIQYLINNSNNSIGYRANGSDNYFDGYMAEIYCIDGLALTPNYFGQTDTTSGAWQPVAYTGLYGTNGFFLPFTNTTSTTTLGYDASGLNNNWTTNNISLTAGSTYDSMTDVPTLTSATEANYCVMNPLSLVSPTTISGGNLDVVTGSSGGGGAYGTFAIPSSGKYYFEYTLTSSSGTVADNGRVGLLQSSGVDILYLSDGNKRVDGSGTAYGAS